MGMRLQEVLIPPNVLLFVCVSHLTWFIIIRWSQCLWSIFTAAVCDSNHLCGRRGHATNKIYWLHVSNIEVDTDESIANPGH